jgi:hypothetical protein
VMTLSDLLKLAQSRLAYLNGQRADAVAIGDADAIARLDVEIGDTQTTIAQLQGMGA